MKKFSLRLYLSFVVLTIVSVSASTRETTQRGGKAEPLRISFRRGSDSASVSDRVRGDEEAEYLVGARAGQQMLITVQTQPPGSVVVTVTDPDGSQVELNRNGTDRWNAKLNGDGDYQLVVKKRKHDRVASKYTMKVRIL
jgi:hypothetical protein